MKTIWKAAATLAALFAPGLAAAEWRAAETAHFIIYSESPDKQIERLATRLEAIDALMRMATNISDDVEPVKVRIYEVETTEDVQKALGLTSSGVAGFYSSNALGPFAVTPRRTSFDSATFTPELVLHHEYAHHFMLQYFPAVYPGWYTEGFAELIGSSKIQADGKVAYGLPAKHRGNEIAAYWVSLEEVLLKPARQVRGLDRYAQGWAMTHYLTFAPERAGQLRRYLQALSAGKSQAEAAQVFGDLRKLNREARLYVTRGTFPYKEVPVKIAQPVIQKIRPLSAGEAALIPETIAFSDDDLSAYRKEGARERERALRDATLRRIRDKAARFAADPFALNLLAEAEYAAGNHREAEAAAERLLALAPRHARGMSLKSLSLARAAGALAGPARAAKAAEARKLALEANRADPDDTLPLFAFYQSYHLAGEKPSKAAVTALMQVVETVPADTRARQLLVDQLAADGRWAAAIAFLQPIANSPHESPQRTAAQEQMAKLVAALNASRGTPAEAEEAEAEGPAAS
jgi:tetratricopeptide (TPR) repeat protein